MKNGYILLLCFIFFTRDLVAAPKYELAVCAIFQNEAPYLKEWIEYHRLIGVEHFYLYNNSSVDQYQKVLKPYIKKGVVELIDWPSPPIVDWTPYQKKAYNHCIRCSQTETNWLAIIDIDEYIVPVNAKNLRKILRDFDQDESIGGVCIFWQCFGTSRVQSIPASSLMIEHLIRKAPKEFSWNHHVKSICKPKAVAKYEVHGAHYHPGFRQVGDEGQRHLQTISTNALQINHYWTRDENYFFNFKIPRRNRIQLEHPIGEQEIEFFQRHFNLEEDTTILRFVPALKKKMSNN